MFLLYTYTLSDPYTCTYLEHPYGLYDTAVRVADRHNEREINNRSDVRYAVKCTARPINGK